MKLSVNEVDICQEFVACHVIYITHLIHTTILKMNFRACSFLGLEQGRQKWFSKTAWGISIKEFSYSIRYFENQSHLIRLLNPGNQIMIDCLSKVAEKSACGKFSCISLLLNDGTTPFHH